MENLGRIMLARPQWQGMLTDMWEKSFGDGRERIGLFHKHFPVENYAWCYAEGDRPLSVIYALPGWRWSRCGREPVRYLYAGATGILDRGRGYYGRLLREVCGAGAASYILMPVPELIPYYEKLGFVLMQKEADEAVGLGDGGFPRADGRPAGVAEAGMSDGPGADISMVRKINAGRYKELRDLRFGRPGYVEWDENYLAYALESLEAEGGQAMEVRLEGEAHILLGREDGHCLKLTETSLSSEQLVRAAGFLKSRFQCDLAVRKGAVLMGFGKAWEETPYFNIPLDE